MNVAIKPSEQVIINCFLLHNLRVERRLSVEQVVRSTGLAKREVYRYETFIEPTPGDPLHTRMRKTQYRNVKKLEEFFGLHPYALVISHQDDIAGEDIRMFHQNKYRAKNSSDGQQNFRGMTLKTKAVCFDFDGTLTVPLEGFNTWEKIWTELGYDTQECYNYHRQFSKGEISHEEWCAITLNKFRDKGLCSDQVRQIAKSFTLIEDVQETFNVLLKQGIKIYLVSGSICTVVKEVLGESLWDSFSGTSMNRFRYDNDLKLVEIIGTVHDFEGKRDFIFEICDDEGFSPNEVWFIGNDHNDEWAYESGANTLCINPARARIYDHQRWHHCIHKTQTLTSILKFVL
ncbi:MAG: HAD family hydrolase [Pontibacterium sp.]